MQLSQEIITAPAAAVLDSGEHLFWSSDPDESLRKSIEEIGQTTPVLAQETEGGLELISGHARLAALREQNIPVMIRLVMDADTRDKGLLYLTDNSHRVLDDGMRLAALRYFAELMNPKELVSDILPRLGVKPKSKDAKLFKTWLTLNSEWHDALFAGNVPLAAGAILARMTDADRAAVLPLFTAISWSRSNAVNVLTWLFEASKMRETDVAAVLADSGMNDISAQGLSPKDAIAKFVAAAKAIRFPELGKLQDTFSKAAREITAGTKWRMIQPNNFETGGSELTIQVKDAKQLAQAIKDLEAMAGLTPWETVWKLGGGND